LLSYIIFNRNIKGIFSQSSIYSPSLSIAFEWGVIHPFCRTPQVELAAIISQPLSADHHFRGRCLSNLTFMVQISGSLGPDLVNKIGVEELTSQKSITSLVFALMWYGILSSWNKTFCMCKNGLTRKFLAFGFFKVLLVLIWIEAGSFTIFISIIPLFTSDSHFSNYSIYWKMTIKIRLSI